MKNDPELFSSEPVPKKQARARRAPIVEADPEPAAEIDPVEVLDDLRVAGERFIREQPLLAVTLAVGIGFLIGRIRR